MHQIKDQSVGIPASSINIVYYLTFQNRILDKENRLKLVFTQFHFLRFNLIARFYWALNAMNQTKSIELKYYVSNLLQKNSLFWSTKFRCKDTKSFSFKSTASHIPFVFQMLWSRGNINRLSYRPLWPLLCAKFSSWTITFQK